MSVRAWLSFGAVSVLWGIPYLFIKVAVEDGVPPVFLAWARVALAAVVVVGLAWRAGVLPSTRGRLKWLGLYAVVEIVVPFPLIAVGEQWVASSLAAIVIAAVPLFVALLALRFDASERVSGSRLVGLLIGLAASSSSLASTSPGAPTSCWARRRSSSPPSAMPPGRWSSTVS